MKLLKTSKEIIKIIFLQTPNGAHVYNDSEEIDCKVNGLELECEITKKKLPVDKKKPKIYKKYELNIMDACNNKKYTFNVFVKEEEEDQRNYIWIYSVVGVVGLIIILIVAFLMYRAAKTKNNIEKEDGGKNLLAKSLLAK